MVTNRTLTFANCGLFWLVIRVALHILWIHFLTSPLQNCLCYFLINVLFVKSFVRLSVCTSQAIGRCILYCPFHLYLMHYVLQRQINQSQL